MDAEPAGKLQELVLVRMAELGSPGVPMPLATLVERCGGAMGYDELRALGRGERSEVLTDRQAAALAVALDVPVTDVEAAATVLRRV